MSFSDLDVKSSTQGNGVTVDFAIPFHYQNESEVEVYLRDETDPDDITEEMLTEGELQDYTLTGATPPTTPLSTTVTMNVAPVADTFVVIRRVVPMTQPTSVTNTISSATHNRVWDRLVMQIQQVWELAQRAPSFSKTYFGSVPEFDAPVNDAILVYSADSSRIEAGPPVNDIAGYAATASQAAQDAAEQAEAAAVVAQDAATSATASANSATAAAAAAAAAAASAAAAAGAMPNVINDSFTADSVDGELNPTLLSAWKSIWWIQGQTDGEVLTGIEESTIVGQELVLFVPAGGNVVNIPDSAAHVNLNGDWSGQPNRALSLIWDGVNWLEQWRR